MIGLGLLIKKGVQGTLSAFGASEETAEDLGNAAKWLYCIGAACTGVGLVAVLAESGGEVIAEAAGESTIEATVETATDDVSFTGSGAQIEELERNARSDIGNAEYYEREGRANANNAEYYTKEGKFDKAESYARAAEEKFDRAESYRKAAGSKLAEASRLK